MWDLGSNQFTQVAQHDHGVKECAYLNEYGLLLTGSWDKRLCYWDGRSASATHVHMLQDRVNSMDVKGQSLVVATAHRHIQARQLKNIVTCRVDF